MNEVEKYYDKQALQEWERFNQHRTEFAVTMHALAEYLPPPPCTILDIGGGPGRYSIALAQKSYAVTLFDLSRENLELAKCKAQEANVKIDEFIHGNALQLENLEVNGFDAVLLMGPLYHLPLEQDRIRVVREASRVLKPGGVIFAAFITRSAPFRGSAQGYPEWYIDNYDVAERILKTGIHDHPVRFTQAYFAHPGEVEPFMEKQGWQTLDLIGCEGVVAGHEERINQLQGEAWEMWVKLNYKIGKDPTMHGASDHLLYIGRQSG